jgi:hypothetical protein
MAISYSGEGYKFQPQFANLGALQGLQPLDVTRRAQFETRPLTYAEIPSSRPELVSEGFSKGILAAVGGITEGITAKYKSEQAKEEKTTERAHEIQVANIKASGYDDTLTRQKALYDYKLDKDTKKRLEGSLGANYPVYMDGETTEEPVTENVPIDEELPDLETPLSETSVDGTSLFSSLTPAEQMQGQIAEQAKQLEGLSPEYLTAGTEGGAVAPIQAAPIMSLEGLKVTAISPEQAQETLDTRKELRQTLSGIQPPKAVKEQPQQPGWRPIAQAEAEAGREISGWQKAEIDPKNVQMIRGVPHFLVLPRKPKSQKEIAEEKSALTAPEMSKEQNAILMSQIGKLESDKTYSKALESRDSRDIIFTSLSKEDGFSDIAAINAFQRLIDPGVAVREGDVALIQSAQAFISKYNPTFIAKKFTAGDKLPPEDREKMRLLTKELARIQMEKANEGPIKKFRKLTEKTGIDPDLIAMPFEIEVPKEAVQQDQKQSLVAQLDAMADKKGTPEYQAMKNQLKEIILQEKKAQQPQAVKPTVTKPVFQPAVPRQMPKYEESIESWDQ